MQVTVTIPDELAAQVRARGLTLDAYLRSLVEEKLSCLPTDTEQRSNAVEAMLRFADRHGFTTDGQSLKTALHTGHKY